jgi:hypothetical protein
MILTALNMVGGAKYLAGQAKTNPNAFMALVGKVLPLTIAGDKNNPVTMSLQHMRNLSGDELAQMKALVLKSIQAQAIQIEQSSAADGAPQEYIPAESSQVLTGGSN